MTWLLVAAAVAIVSGLISWWVVGRFGRTSVLLWFAVPGVLWMVVFFAAFLIAVRVATCDSPDCGPLMFVASLLFAGTLSISGLVGSALGVWRAARGFNRG